MMISFLFVLKMIKHCYIPVSYTHLFAVSIADGIQAKRLKISSALKIAIVFGVFQALMPIIGFYAGTMLRDLIAAFDHWIAFGLLVFIGGKMLYESIFKKDDDTKQPCSSSTKLLIVMAIATSIDALARCV